MAGCYFVTPSRWLQRIEGRGTLDGDRPSQNRTLLILCKYVWLNPFNIGPFLILGYVSRGRSLLGGQPRGKPPT